MKARLFAPWICLTVMIGCAEPPKSITPQDVEVLKSLFLERCGSQDDHSVLGRVVMTSQVATTRQTTTPPAWADVEDIVLDLNARSDPALNWPSVELCTEVRFDLYSSVNAIFEDAASINDAWDLFYEQYTGSSGFAMVSLPGFNATRDRAVIYIEVACGPLCGVGTYFELRKIHQEWKIVRTADVLFANLQESDSAIVA